MVPSGRRRRGRERAVNVGDGVAVVTGAGGGIGAALARALAGGGAGVVAGDERILVLPHPEVLEYLRRTAAEHDRRLAGMRRLQAPVA